MHSKKKAIKNVKFYLNIELNDLDEKIAMIYDKIKLNVENYCNRKFNEHRYIDDFIETKLINCVKASLDITYQYQSENEEKEVKSITRGDTRIDYNVATKSTSSKEEFFINSFTFNDEEKKYLNKHRVIRWK